MRRRSERKKSTDVTSPAPTRRTRSRKSESTSEVEKNVEITEEQKDLETLEAEQNARASSEERFEANRRGRNTRNRTPVSPMKRKNQRAATPDKKIDVILEEENGSATNADEDEVRETVSEEIATESEKIVEAEEKKKKKEESPVKTEVTIPSPAFSPKKNVENKLKTLDVLEIQAEDTEKDNIEGDVTVPQSISPRNISPEKGQPATIQDEQNDIPFVNEDAVEPTANEEIHKKPETPKKETKDNSLDQAEVKQSSEPKEIKKISPSKIARTRKRKWITKKANDSKAPILSISSDSLKNLIADVRPVPLSDVQLESSSDIEEVLSEREEGEETPTPDRDHQQPATVDVIEKIIVKRNHSEEKTVIPGHNAKVLSVDQRSPSPARNNASSVLFITNLVRPFTVLQLKGLLARTGKIVENGFWIDRIKSKCYVQYETDDEAIETRHALHGVRWPVSNPKCLCVEFGNKIDMERSIQSTQDETPKFGQDNNKDNVIAGTGWNRERIDIEDKKNARAIRPVREWDVGKKESLERTKTRDVEKRRSRDRDTSGNRENEKNERDGKHRSKNREQRSRSRTSSPVRKLKKKENEPPLRLLDDLFRKTRAAPSIYWLPLTPEQIAEKEAFRQKRVEEHKQRMKQREEEREKEREKERNRGNNRHNRSNDRRRSRSRDRRRY